MKKLSWFYESISKAEAEVILSEEKKNCFLVRSTEDGLVLSFKISGWSYHEDIRYTPEGFCYLRRKYSWFKSIVDMIAHYQKNPVDFVSPTQTLAYSCDRKCSGKNVSLHVSMKLVLLVGCNRGRALEIMG